MCVGTGGVSACVCARARPRARNVLPQRHRSYPDSISRAVCRDNTPSPALEKNGLEVHQFVAQTHHSRSSTRTTTISGGDVLNVSAKRKAARQALGPTKSIGTISVWLRETFLAFREPRPTKFDGFQPPRAPRIFPPSGLPRPVVGSQPGPALNAPLFPETISWNADGF